MSQSSNTPYEALDVGQTASYTRTVGERDIQLFAEVSGDRNPVHLDALELGLGAQGQTVGESRMSQALHVVGGDEVTTREPCPGTRCAEQRGGATRRHPGRQRRGLPGRPGDVDDVAGDLRGDLDRPDQLAGGLDVGP